MKTTVLLAIVVAMLAMLSLSGARRTSAGENPTVPVQPPARNSAPAGADSAPPPVPPEAEGLTPAAIVVRSTAEGRMVTTQVVTRTRNRVRLVVEGERTEWLFVRNPVAPDRVSGYLVDHRARQIVEYDDTALRARQGLRGWADVITMRFDSRLLPALRATGRSERRHGIEFVQFVAADPDRPGTAEVLWNQSQLLPLRLVVRTGGALLSAEMLSVEPVTDLAGLEMPAARFPDYATLDVADASDHRD